MEEKQTKPGQPEDMLAPMEFELQRREVPVTLRDPTDGRTKDYILVELDGAGRDAYLNNLGGRVRTNAAGKMAGLKTFDGLQADLLCRCMFEVDGQGRKAVTAKMVQAWPARIQTALFKRCKEISGLGDDSKEEEGHD